ncbi:MAG: toll/interleukin-1 receptor domain-containing protein [Lachnospiraceae bacterium]|nr:toll/interleukin-1 receptor domain-containing protein [Lachnospiraceae bacterium]
MKRADFISYEGGRPYIFISYAHKDCDKVIPVLEDLNRRGYRVWYDDGIEPGSE